MNVKIGTRTDAGKRDNNEDAVLVFERGRRKDFGADALIIVADGMGGRASGEEASALAVAAIKETVEALLRPGPGMPPFEELMGTAMRRANSAVYELARSKPGQQGMGTTCVAALFAKNTATVAHVGDSRAYLLRDGLLRRLTDDHSYIQDQVKSGHLSDHDARHSRFRHVITKAIGIEAAVEPDIHTYDLKEGDAVLLCTDGLSNIVDESGMIQIISRARNAQEAVDYLVDAAKRGGSKDNITGAVILVGESDVEFTKDNDFDDGADTAAPRQSRERSGSGESIIFDNPLPVRRFPVGALIGGLLLGIVICYALLLASGIFVFKSSPPFLAAKAGARSTKKAIDYRGVTYAAPITLLDQTVLGNVLAGSDAGVVVARSADGNLLLVSPTGSVKPSGAIDTDSGAMPARFVATDSNGYIYVSTSVTQLLKRYTPDGTFDRTIAQGLLDHPQAVYVSRNADIYIVDDGKLKLIKAKLPGAELPKTTVTSPSAPPSPASPKIAPPAAPVSGTASH